MSAGHDNNWMPLYVGDYLRDTTRLTVAEHGAYLLLIMDYWVNGPPPDDDRELARIARTPLATWRKYRRGTLIKLFTLRGGRWLHKRIDAELARAHELNEKKRRAGLASAAGRRTRNGTAQPEHLFEHRSKCVRGSVQTPLPCKEEGFSPKELNPVSLTTREPSPPLPSQGDGDAASRSHIPEPPAEMLVRDDPASRAYCEARLDEALTYLTSMFKPAKDPPPPTPPHIVAFRAMLRRLNSKVGEHFSGVRREQAWAAIATAEAIGDPNALPPDLVAQLASLEAAAA